MTCKYTHAAHDWIKLLEIYDTDWEPGITAWWCRGCGAASTSEIYDNRTFNERQSEPKIIKKLDITITYR